MKKNIKLIACGIFEKEISRVLGANPEIDIEWIDAALHADPDSMEKELALTSNP